MRSALATAFRFLIFRAGSEELLTLNCRHLAIGLLSTWIVGAGRWWEDPHASALQHTGIGSVIYVFILAFFLWLVLWPLAPRHWSLFNVLTFVSLTAPPAILYAIPVRHGLNLQLVQTVRLGMLAIVAGWRVALLVFYLHRIGFREARIVIAALFPLTLIVFTLTALNLEKVVFDIMGGIHSADRTVNDAAYGILVLITMFSTLLFLPLFGVYLVMSVRSSYAKMGGRSNFVVYPLAVLCGCVGLISSRHGLVLLGTVLACAGLVLAVTAAFQNKTENTEQ